MELGAHLLLGVNGDAGHDERTAGLGGDLDAGRRAAIEEQRSDRSGIERLVERHARDPMADDLHRDQSGGRGGRWIGPVVPGRLAEDLVADVAPVLDHGGIARIVRVERVGAREELEEDPVDPRVQDLIAHRDPARHPVGVRRIVRIQARRSIGMIKGEASVDLVVELLARRQGHDPMVSHPTDAVVPRRADR